MTDTALTNCRLMVATPIYEGAQGTYVRAALDLALRAQATGVPDTRQHGPALFH